MDFSLQNQIFALLAVFIFGFGFLYWRMVKFRKQFDPIFRETGTEEEIDLKQNIIRRIIRLETKIEEYEPRLDILERISKISVQKVGFLRFNPFQDMGGDNSFIAVFLDASGSGVMISSLYSREGVRLYAKHIQNGSSKHHLSEEEKKVLEETIHKNY